MVYPYRESYVKIDSPHEEKKKITRKNEIY